MDQFAVTVIISVLSLFIAGVSLGWNIYRDYIDRGRLKVSAFIADVFIPDVGKQPKVMSVRVTNVGKQPITVDYNGPRKPDCRRLDRLVYNEQPYKEIRWPESIPLTHPKQNLELLLKLLEATAQSAR